MQPLLDIVHEDDRLLVVNKPADLVCHPTKRGPLSSLISRARLHLGPAARPQLINRLDRETSGLVLIGKDAATARELRGIWEDRAVEKVYLAIVHGRVREDQFRIDAPLGPDQHSPVAIKNCVRPDGQPAQTEVRTLRRVAGAKGEFSLLEVRPLTGRKHQIRIHLAHAGHPVVGDKIYGGDEQVYLDFVLGRMSAAQREKMVVASHALHAERVTFTWRGERRQFSAPAPATFHDLLG